MKKKTRCFYNIHVKIFLIISFLLILSIHKTYSQSGWIVQNLNNKDNIRLNFPSLDTGYIIQQGGDLYKTINNGVNWYIVNTGIMGMSIGKFTTSLLGVILSGPSNLTSDGGLSWSTINNSLPANGAVFLHDLFFLNVNTGYYCGTDIYPWPVPCCYDGVIYKTTNSGGVWELVFRSGGNQLQEITFKDENNITILERGSIIRTTNAGNNWTSTLGYFGDIFFNAWSMTDPYLDTVFVAGYRSGDSAKIVKSTNRGNSWSVSLQLNFRSRLRKIFFLNGSTGFAVGDSGLIVRTTNGGTNWTPQSSGTRMRLNGVWFLNKDTGFVVGDSGIVLKTTTGGVLTNFTSSISNIPDFYYLGQNYPNPFNPSTKIKFDIVKTQNVTLKVFDMLGKDVAQLVNQNLSPGSYSVDFDASGISSGMYFYRLETEGYSETRRMVLMK